MSESLKIKSKVENNEDVKINLNNKNYSTQIPKQDNKPIFHKFVEFLNNDISKELYFIHDIS